MDKSPAAKRARTLFDDAMGELLRRWELDHPTCTCQCLKTREEHGEDPWHGGMDLEDLCGFCLPWSLYAFGFPAFLREWSLRGDRAWSSCVCPEGIDLSGTLTCSFCLFSRMLAHGGSTLIMGGD